MRTGILAVFVSLLATVVSAAESTPAVATPTVAVFNVNGGYDTPVGTWEQRLPLVIDTMLRSGATVFALQEAHEGKREPRQILRALRAASDDRWVLIRGKGGNHFIIDGSLYRKDGRVHTIRLPHARHYSDVPLVERASDVRFWVWTTHLIATNSKYRPSEMARAMRAEQAAVVARRLVRLPRAVGGGDINEWPSDSGVRSRLAAVDHDDVRTRTGVVENAQMDSHKLNYRPNQLRGHWIDLLAAGRLVTVTAAGLVPSGDASDHNLIYASVSIPGPRTK